jgi:RNA polymerase sigma-54 factor
MLGQRLEARQAQSLVMTPQLQQAIKLLQLSSTELADYIAEQVEQNPLLEAEYPSGLGNSLGDSIESALSHTDISSAFDVPLDASSNDLWNASSDIPNIDLPWRGDEEEDDWLARQAAPVGLKEHLSNQARTLFSEPLHKAIALYLIDLVEEDGFLRAPFADIAASLGVEEAAIETVLHRLQQLDPVGVFARSLAECYSLQLREHKALTPALAALLERLEKLGEGRFEEVRRACRVEQAEFTAMLSTLKHLDPRPGWKFRSGEAAPMLPDVLVRFSGAAYAVDLNQDTLPKVLIKSAYYSETLKRMNGKADKEFLTTCHHAATFLEKALAQRTLTLLKVAKSIVAEQENFLKFGIRHLKPMTLKDIAAQTGLHESTISRVTTSKFMATPRGVFDFRYFFSSGVGDGGDGQSARSIQHRIKALIESEPAGKPLSDDALADMLNNEGTPIARRTVAKYREAMHIPTSAARKRRIQ